jgi:hypothetical protein
MAYSDRIQSSGLLVALDVLTLRYKADVSRAFFGGAGSRAHVKNLTLLG